MKRSMMVGSFGGEEKKSDSGGGVALCASCDRCRTRKTRCDGQRPCANCKTKYMKKHKINSIDGVPLSDFECVYSPAKRRGPVPGRVGLARKAEAAKTAKAPAKSKAKKPADQLDIMLLQETQDLTFDDDDDKGNHNNNTNAFGGANNNNDNNIHNTGGEDDELNKIEGLMDVSQMSLMEELQDDSMISSRSSPPPTRQKPSSSFPENINHMASQGPARRIKTGNGNNSSSSLPFNKQRTNPADTVTTHKHLLSSSSPEGNRLRSCYTLSVDELFSLPPTPTDYDYVQQHPNFVTSSPLLLPRSHSSALCSARFAALALGAIVHNEIALSSELCHAAVRCLRDACTAQPIQPSYEFEIARAYFLIGCYRAFRGDMVRYFKYRRVCMSNVAKFEQRHAGSTDRLLAAMAYMDSWAYMMHNGSEEAVPNIDGSIPKVSTLTSTSAATNEIGAKYGVGCGAPAIAADPKNQTWIQGAPPVYLNNEAPLPARSLDALACAIRSCCDHANSRFHEMSKVAVAETGGAGADSLMADLVSLESSLLTPTATAVMAHENELCSRNMVVSAATLLRQHEAFTGTIKKNHGHHMVISAIDAFLDNGDEDGSGGFTDAQVQALLGVCNTALANPLVLYHGGPTYHIVSNAAILLCHLLNGMHAARTATSTNDGGGEVGSEMEAQVFCEILDTFLSVRKLLNLHRRKLPVKLRCHSIPRPSLSGPRPGEPFVDLGETLLCACRGCQGFVLMACSPCVAAERAKKAQAQRDLEEGQEQTEGIHLDSNDHDVDELDKAIVDLETEFELDDDALLQYLSGAIS